MQQHKLEIKGKTFRERIYYSEDGGNSYDMLLRVLILIEFGKMTNLVWSCSNVCWCYFEWSTPENAHIAASIQVGYCLVVLIA
jgi:hypothetical protein